MAVFKNNTSYTMRFGAFDAGGRWMKQKWPDIPSGKCRYVNEKHMGGSDYFFMLVYLDNTPPRKIPDVMTVTQTTQGFVVGGSGAILGSGGGATFGLTWTTQYSNPLAGVAVARHEMFVLDYKANERKYEFVFRDDPHTSADLMGW